MQHTIIGRIVLEMTNASNMYLMSECNIPSNFSGTPFGQLLMY